MEQPHHAFGWSADGAWLLTSDGGQGTHIRVWDGVSGKLLQEVSGADPQWSPDGRFVIYRAGDLLAFLRMADGAHLFRAVPAQVAFTEGGPLRRARTNEHWST